MSVCIKEKTGGKITMYEDQARRALRRKREAMRRRRLKRKIRLCACLFVTAVILVAAAGLVRGIAKAGGKDRKDWLAGDAGAEDLRQTFVDAKDADLVSPKARQGDEIYRALQELAGSDDGFEEILERYDEYPEELLAALCSNPEMLPFAAGYLDSDGKVHGGLTEEETAGGIPLLIQWDKRWGYVPYGSSGNIALSGCAPTCLSMVIVAITGDDAVTPDAVADFAMEQGYYLEGTGTVWSIMTEGAAHYGVTGQEISLDEGVILRHLDRGEPIICSMGPGDFTTAGHFIVLTGTVEGKITVNDPNSPARSQVLWSYDEIAPQIKNLWAFTRS